VASNPKLKALEAHLVDEAAILGCTPDEVVFDRLRSGESVADVMDSYGFSRNYFYTWLKRGNDRKGQYEEAKRDAAEALVDEAQAILDDEAPVFSPAEVTLRKARANFRTWLAGKKDREQFGEANAQVDVNLNLGSLHLDALRATSTVPTALPAPEEDAPEIQEAEWEPVEEAEDPFSELT
jgi:hypothetical protein